jgi:hypothetical protein
MPESSLRKVFIPNSQLPPITFDTTTELFLGESREEINNLFYALRYRIVSEDRNRRSHWSPITKIAMPDITTPFPYTASNRFSISKSADTEVINAVWSFPGDSENPTEYEKTLRETSSYDVWARWTTSEEEDVEELSELDWGAWEYEATVSSNNFSILKKDSSVTRIEIAIQVPTVRKIRDYYNNKLTLFTGISDII